MPTRTLDKGESKALLEAEYEVRRAAQRQNQYERVFSPKALTENKVEAFGLWLVRFFPHKLDEVEEWQMEPLRIMVEEPRGLILVPAGTMKSTIGAELYPIWRLCQCRNYERNGFFKHDQAAKESLSAVAIELQTNEPLIEAYGRFIPSSDETRRFRYKWNEHQIDVAGRTRKSRSNSLSYRGYSGQGLGARCHMGHLDDVILEEMARSPEQTDKFMSWLGSSFETMPYPRDSRPDWDLDDSGGTPFDDQLLIFGTRWNDQDGYSRIEKRNKNPDALANEEFRPYSVISIDLLKDEDKQETITPRWPWWRAMAKKSEIGPKDFNARYRNKPYDPESQVFKEIWFTGGADRNDNSYPGCWDESLTRESVLEGQGIVTIGYDPQSGSKTRFAKCAAVVMLANRPDAQGRWLPQLCDWWMGQTEIIDIHDPEAQLSIILRMAKAANGAGYTPTVVMEGNAIQKGLKQPLLDLGAAQGIRFWTEMGYTGDNKHDPETGVEALAVDFQNGWLRIPAREPSDRDHYGGFVKQMVGYGMTKYSDIPMAYWMARRHLYTIRFSGSPRESIIHKSMPNWMKSRLMRRGLHPCMRIIDAHAPVVVEEDVDHA